SLPGLKDQFGPQHPHSTEEKKCSIVNNASSGKKFTAQQQRLWDEIEATGAPLHDNDRGFWMNFVRFNAPVLELLLGDYRYAKRTGTKIPNPGGWMRITWKEAYHY